MKDRLGRYLMQWRIHCVIPFIKGKVLDIGCGTNALVAAYDGKGIGVDVYPWENVDLVVENTADLPFDGETFDSVTIIAALNHIANRKEVLKEARRLLKPSGRIIITMISPGIGRIWHFFRKPWDADQKHRGMSEGEVYGMSRNQVHQLLLAAGFQVVYEKTFMFGLNRITVGCKQ